jgi:drug/metabolite transporter (DMT)-like permease
VRPALDRRRFLALAALVLLPVFWGYTWVTVKIALADSPPFTLAALRMLPGGLILLILVAITRRPVKPKAVLLTMALGLLQGSGFVGLTVWALVSGAAGRTSILANTWQFWIPLMAWPLLGERLQRRGWMAVLLGMVGLVLIIEPWKLSGVTSSLLVLAAAFCWAGGSLVAKVIRRRHDDVDLLSLTAWQGLFGSVPLVVAAFAVGGGWPHWTGSFIWSYAYSMLICTVLCGVLWLYVLREMPAGVASLATMGTPVVGILTSWAQLGERPSLVETAGMVIILFGLGALLSQGLAGAAEPAVVPVRARGGGRAPSP